MELNKVNNRYLYFIANPAIYQSYNNVPQTYGKNGCVWKYFQSMTSGEMLDVSTVTKTNFD